MNPVDKKFPNVFIDRRMLYTKSSGKPLFDERFRKGYREWDPKRSKLAAAIMKKISQSGLKEDSVVLYLGASHGYTPSFISDICKKGFIFAIDVAPEVVRDLVHICEQRKNMAPILANCNHPELYEKFVKEADIVYQDIAQRNQVEIFLKNCDKYLKKDGFGLLALKSRSVDVTKKPKQIYKEVMEELNKHMKVVDYRVLDPYEKDHAFFVCKK